MTVADSSVLLTAEARAALLERLRTRGSDAWRVRYWRTKADYASMDGHEAEQLTLVETVRLLSRATVSRVEVPEPLYLKYWPRTAAVLLAAHLVRAATRRKRLLVVTYAIENFATTDELPFASGWRRPLAPLIRASLRSFIAASSRALIDAVAFGTDAARLNYGGYRALGPTTAVTTIPERFVKCASCYPSGAKPTPIETRPKRVLFAGELALRKGIDTLLAAWVIAKPNAQGWTLCICGSGPYEAVVAEAAQRYPSIEWLTPSRSELHELYATSRVVVLPSRQEKRWKEQAGLSLLEGEAHGCGLIASSDSGIAAALRIRSNAAIVEGGDLASLVGAFGELDQTTASSPGTSDSRCEVQCWFEGFQQQ